MVIGINASDGSGGLAHGARVLNVAVGLTLRQPEALRQPVHGFARRNALGEQRVGGVEPLDLLGSC